MAQAKKKNTGKAVAITLLLIGAGIAGYFLWKKYGRKEENEVEDVEAEVIEPTRASKAAMENLVFASGKSIIKSSSFSALDALANELNANPSWKLSLVGHTDSDGNAQANLVLSKSRAEAVKKYLVNKGIAAERIKTEGRGEDQPLVNNTTPANKAQNRRVEFNIQTA